MVQFDSEAFYERLYSFASACQKLIKGLERYNYNIVYGDQLLRSSSSVGANYIEAIEALSKKDFIFRLRICRKETRESIHWLRLILDSNPTLNKQEIGRLIQEAQEIKKIFSSSILTSEKKLGTK